MASVTALAAAGAARAGDDMALPPLLVSADDTGDDCGAGFAAVDRDSAEAVATPALVLARATVGTPS